MGPMVTSDRPRLLRCLLPVGVVLALAACASPAGGPATGPEDIARAEVASRLGVVPADVRIISSEARDFPDGSLGCPQPGMAYAQVITPGHRVLVEADGRRFDVRVAGTRGRICHLRKPPSGAGASVSPREAAEAARQDLAARLGVPVEPIAVTALARLEPGQVVPGCGVVCPADSTADGCGLVMQLEVDGQAFSYIALPGGVRPCPDIAPR